MCSHSRSPSVHTSSQFLRMVDQEKLKILKHIIEAQEEREEVHIALGLQLGGQHKNAQT